MGPALRQVLGIIDNHKEIRSLLSQGGSDLEKNKHLYNNHTDISSLTMISARKESSIKWVVEMQNTGNYSKLENQGSLLWRGNHRAEMWIMVSRINYLSRGRAKEKSVLGCRMVCTKALGQWGAEEEEKRRPGCQESQSDRKRKLRLEESTESDHQSPGGHGEVLILISMAVRSQRKILGRAVTWSYWNFMVFSPARAFPFLYRHVRDHYYREFYATLHSTPCLALYEAGAP